MDHYTITLTDTDTADGSSTAVWTCDTAAAARQEAISFVCEGSGPTPAYHVTQHPDTTVYWLGSREAAVAPPLPDPER
jgi:hypothetical protein